MKNLGRKLGVAIGLVGLVGCAEIQQGARSPFAQNLAANAIGSAVGDVIHQEIQSQYPENIPQTNISVNNYQGGQTPTQTYTEEQYRQLQQQRQTRQIDYSKIPEYPGSDLNLQVYATPRKGVCNSAESDLVFKILNEVQKTGVNLTVINGKTYCEGQYLSRFIRIQKICDNGILLNRNGDLYLLKED